MSTDKLSKALSDLRFSNSHPRFLAYAKVKKAPPKWMPKWISGRLPAYEHTGKIGRVLVVGRGETTGALLFTLYSENEEGASGVYFEEDLEFLAS